MTKQTNKESWNMASEEKHTPEVIAYRVGELERKTTGGFAALNKKLDDYLSTFATKTDVDEAVKNVREDMVDKSDYISLKTKVTLLFWVIGSISAVAIAIFAKRFIDIMTQGQL